MTGARGFTLIEAMVALVIAGIIVSAGASTVTSLNARVTETRRRVEGWDEAQRLEEYLVSRVQGAGGGALRAWAAVLVEDGDLDDPGTCSAADPRGLPECLGSDRMTLHEPNRAFPQCPVLTAAGTMLTVDAPAGVCCLDGGLFPGEQGIIIGANREVRSVTLGARSGACDIDTAPGHSSVLLPGTVASASPGILVVVRPVTLYVDRTGLGLFEWRDVDGDALADADEIRPIHPGVNDLQLALGYDALPEDGELPDGQNATDEWLFNAVGDTKLGVAGTFATTTRDQVRMVDIGVIVAVNAPSSARPARLFNGPSRTSAGMYLVATRSRAALRNLGLFVQ